MGEVSFSEHVGSNGTIIHHAFIIKGGAETVRHLISFLEKEHSIVVHGNPNFFYNEVETFSIDDSRALVSSQSMTGFDSAKKIFIISFDSITTEAQQSLLKVLEEPTPETHFFFVTPNTEIFLPTIISRVRLIEPVGTSSVSGVKFDAVEFYGATPAKRISMCASLIKAKSRRRTRAFLDELEKGGFELFRGGKVKEMSVFLEKLPTLKQYVGLRGSSLKQIIESACLLAPTTK
jgi:hypothetical protein